MWHLPLFFTPGQPQYGARFLVFLLWLIAISIIHTLISNNTKGSVLIASAFHAAYNTSTTYLPGVPVVLDLVSTWLIAGLMTLTVALAKRHTHRSDHATAEPITADTHT